MEAFDDALEEDASNFKEARGHVGSTRYEALRTWMTRDVEGYDEMRDEHKAMDARLRRAWNEFPEKRRQAVLNREFEHLSAFLEELNRHGDFERARGARGTPRFDGIASCEAMNKSDLNASREELLAKFRTAKRDWQQKQRDDAKMRALRHLEDFAEEFKSTGDFESSRGPAESERRVALAALALGLLIVVVLALAGFCIARNWPRQARRRPGGFSAVSAQSSLGPTVGVPHLAARIVPGSPGDAHRSLRLAPACI